MKNVVKSSVLIVFVLFVGSCCINAQNTHETFVNVIPQIKKNNLHNDCLKMHLQYNDSLSSIILTLSNLTNDTIQIMSRTKLEGVSPLNFMLFCLSDSCLRTECKPFDFSDENRYSYSHIYWDNYVVKTGEFGCGYMNLTPSVTEALSPQDAIKVPLVDIAIHKRFLFLKVQLKIMINSFWYTVQMDTNSIYVP